MNDHRGIRLWLKEAEVYLQFLNEDLDRIESLRESIASQMEKLLKGATKKLQESLNLLDMEMREEKDKKSKLRASIL